MQHAAIENSNLMAPMLTGTSFSPVSSPHLLFNQYKTISLLHSLPGLELSALKEPLRFIARHHCRKAGVNALSLNTIELLSRGAAMAHLRTTKTFLKPVSLISTGRLRVAPGFAGLRGTALAHA